MKQIESIADYHTALSASESKPIVIFKHSITCPVSAHAHDEVKEFAQESDISVYKLIVQDQPELKIAIAEELNVTHESPQVIAVTNRQSTWHASHADITTTSLHAGITGESPADIPAPSDDIQEVTWRDYTQIFFWLAVIVVMIVTITATPKDTDTGPTPAISTEETATEQADPTEVAPTESIQAGFFEQTGNIAPMTPFIESPYHYTFDEITWRLIDLPESGETKVSIWLDGFTRHQGGEPANLRNPFRGCLLYTSPSPRDA